MSDSPAVIAETDRLILRNWSVEDAEAFFRHLNTEPVMRHLGGVKTREQYDTVLIERFIPWQETRGYTFWVVERRSDGEFLGFCGLKLADGTNSSVEGEIEIGWRFREDAWGQGYAREAAIASLDYAFGALGVTRVVAVTVASNEGSWGLMRRLGMRRREDLDYVDPDWPETMNPVIVYEIGAAEWTK
jgi:RimJ/RimL family protein N-acetyltransferase